MTPEGFAAATGVSRETLQRLESFAESLVLWNKRINLVGKATLEDLWQRHMLDSAQLHPLLPAGARTLVDLGSGGGFPGLVLAAMGVPEVHLVDSDARKCAFLREAGRAAGLPIAVHHSRIEAAPPLRADAITARALADLPNLLHLASRFTRPGTICLFLKGKTAAEELTRAREQWTIDATLAPSRSDPGGCIILVRRFARA